jgi:ELWxxDGT repeat protein
MYFSADDLSVTYGTELYQTDGTIAGTKLVSDISPGTGGSSPSQITVVDGVLYFAAGKTRSAFPTLEAARRDRAARRVGVDRCGNCHRVRMRFTENVGSSLSPGDVQVQQLPAGRCLFPIRWTSIPATRIATFSFAIVAARRELSAPRSPPARCSMRRVTHRPPRTASISSSSPADANRDRIVNLADFNRLASNFGQSNRTVQPRGLQLRRPREHPRLQHSCRPIRHERRPRRIPQPAAARVIRRGDDDLLT